MKKKLTMLLVLFLMGIGATMAQIQVQGIVVNEQGEPAIGATVRVKENATLGTVTDIDGKFALAIPSNGRLIISYVGFKTQEVSASTYVKVVMENDTEVLDEVIVVAYGTAKRSAFTGSVSVVNAQKLQKRQTANVVQAWQDKLPDYR